MAIVCPIRLDAQVFDDRCVVSIKGRSVRVNADGSFFLGNIPAGTDLARMTAVCTIAGVPLWGISDEAYQVAANQTYAIDSIGLMSIIPPVVVESINAAPAAPVLTELGQTTSISVNAKFTDGLEDDVSTPDDGTAYRTSNAAIVTVDEEGVVTAVGRGTGLITVTNAGATAVTPIIVSPGDPLTTIEGFVEFSNGAPVVGAVVRICELNLSTTSLAPDGRFRFNNVPTIYGNQVVQATLETGSQTQRGVTPELDLFEGGITDAGIITLNRDLFVWNNPGGGSWHNPGNWNRNALPGPSDDVVIDMPGTYTVTINPGVDTSIGALTLGGSAGVQTLRITTNTQGSFTINARSCVYGSGVLDMRGGTLTLNDLLENRGLISVRGMNTISNSTGMLSNVSGATLRLTGDQVNSDATLTISNGLTNSGHVILTNNFPGRSATMNVTDGAFTNLQEGIVDIAVGQGAGNRIIGAELDNRGTINIDKTTTINAGSADHVNTGTINITRGLTTLNLNFGVTPSFMNQGAINLLAGDLDVNQGPSTIFTNAGSISIADAHLFTFSGGEFIHEAGVIEGVGLFSITNATFTLNADLVVFETQFTLSGCTVNGPSPRRLINNGNLIASNATVFNTPLANQTGAELTFRGQNIFSPNFINGAFENRPDAMLRLEANPTTNGTSLTIANGFMNQGDIEFRNNATTAQQISLTVTNGTLINSIGATITTFSAAPNMTHLLAAQVDNRGLIEVQNANSIGSALQINKSLAHHANSGVIDVVQGDVTISSATSFRNTGTISIAGDRIFALQGGSTEFVQHNGVIEGSGECFFSSVTLTLETDFVVSDTPTAFQSCTVNGPGRLINEGTLTLNSITQINAALSNEDGGLLLIHGGSPFNSTSVNGSFSNKSGATLRLEGTNQGAALTVVNGFSNQGSIELVGSDLATSPLAAELMVTNGTLVNLPGAAISVLNSKGGGAHELRARLSNLGSITVEQSCTLSAPATGIISNAGTIDIESGTLTVAPSNGSFTNTGTITVTEDTTLAISGGAFNQTAGTISGPGSLSLASVASAMFNTNLSGQIGALTLSNSTATFMQSLNNAVTVISLNTSTVAAPNLVNSTALTIAGGTFTGVITNNSGSVLQLTGANCMINGAVFNMNGGRLQILGQSQGAGMITIAQNLMNNGVMELTDDDPNAAAITLNVTAGNLINTGTINVLTGEGGGSRTIAAQLDNQGTLNVNSTGGLTINRPGSDHVNNGGGRINVLVGNLTLTQSGTTPNFANSGQLYVADGATFSVNGGTVTNSSAGIFGGSGTMALTNVVAANPPCSLANSLCNTASIRPGGVDAGLVGVVTLNGNYQSTGASPVLEIEVGGLVAGTSYDRLVVSGTANLSGVLHVNLVNGFQPSLGNSFTVMNYASRTGVFSLQAPALPNGLLWQASYGATGLTLNIVQ